MIYHIYKFHPNDKRTVQTVLEMAKDPYVYLGYMRPQTATDDMLDAGSIDLVVRYPATKRGKWGNLSEILSWYDSDSYEWEPDAKAARIKEQVMEDLEEILAFSKTLERIKSRYMKG